MGARDPVATFQQSVSSILNLNIKIGGEGEEASVSRDTYFKVDVSMSINLPSPKFMFQEDFFILSMRRFSATSSFKSSL